MSALQHEQQPRAGARKVVKVTPTEVRAARLKLVTDRRLGRTTPTWVKRVAEADRSTRAER